MQKTSDTNQYPDGIQLLRIIYKWYKQILIFVAVAVIGAICLSSPFFIPYYYKSEIIFFPPGTNSNKILIEKDPRFGSDKEIDEQIQIIKSSIVRDSLIRKFDLISHYNIDTSKLTWPKKLHERFENNVSINRTPYNSISITVYDNDPVLAAEIANEMVRIADQVKSTILKTNLNLAFNSIKGEYDDKSKEMDKIILHINEFLENPISIGVSEKDKTDSEKLKEQLDIQNAIDKARAKKNISEMEYLKKYQLTLRQLNEIQYTFFQAYVSINSSVPSCYIVTPAEVSYSKIGPKRTIIVIVTFLSSLFTGMLLVIFIEKFKSLRRLITNP